ncbi:MAG: C15orf41 family protein [Thermoplasmatales archaeon]|nr:C15orf41 family protein [Thermoplasmatales archaeon]
MDRATYQRLYDALATVEDVHRIAHEEHRDENLLFVIHTHRVTRDATRRFYPIQRQMSRMASQWKRGRSMLDIAREWRFPPVLMGQMMLKELGIPRRKVWQVFLHPETAPDARLRTEVGQLLEADLIYSPHGMELQRARGKEGEERLQRWLERHGVGYRTEGELRGKFVKTPDALLDDPIYFYGQKITWIESKANFGDDVELRKNLRRQLGPYTELFGEGAVVYWYGYIDNAASPPGILLWDAETIEGLTPSVEPHSVGTPAVRPSKDHARRSHPDRPPSDPGATRAAHADARLP